MTGRHATRHNSRDANEPGIVDALSQIKVEWLEDGPLDGWVHVLGWLPVEIKNPDGRNRLTRSQIAFKARCDRDKLPYAIWRSAEEAVNDVQRRRRML